MSALYQALWIMGKISGCHQLPERSFFWHNKQFALCARCTGCFLGYFIAGFIDPFFRVPIWIAVVLCLPLLIDWGIQYLKIKSSNNIRRFLTCIMCGFGVMCLYIECWASIINLFYNL